MSIKPLIATLAISLNLIDFESGSYTNVAQNPIILDMDFCTDVDDAVAVRMATTLDSMDVCTLMAVGVCTTPSDGSDQNLRAVKGLLTYDGYADVPIGKAHVQEPDTSPYWGVCAEYAQAAIEAKDAVQLYKEVLASCYNKVTIVTTGYLTNIQYLLEDSDGYNLIKNNCARIVVTGGTFPTGRDNNFSFTVNAATAARYVEEHCPVQIVYVPNDVGGQFTAGGLIQQLSPNDILSKALAAFGTQDGRAAWDPTAVFIAAVPSEISNFMYTPISVEFAADGSHKFTAISDAVNIMQNSAVEPSVSGNTQEGNDIKTVSPRDMFETPISGDSGESDVEESTPIVPHILNASRLAVRYKSGISAKQYQDMIEGILSYKYLKQ